MGERTVTSAQYWANVNGDNACIHAVIDGETLTVPLDNNNADYQAVLDWVADGNQIADAD